MTGLEMVQRKLGCYSPSAVRNGVSSLMPMGHGAFALSQTCSQTPMGTSQSPVGETLYGITVGNMPIGSLQYVQNHLLRKSVEVADYIRGTVESGHSLYLPSTYLPTAGGAAGIMGCHSALLSITRVHSLCKRQRRQCHALLHSL